MRTVQNSRPGLGAGSYGFRRAAIVLPDYERRRIKDVLSFIENLTNWYLQVSRLSRGTLIKLIKLGARISTLVPGKG